ncbi:MAG: hypothetical protein ABEI75_00345 [Halobaculum sp.]
MRKRADWMKPADDQILEAMNLLGNVTPLLVSKEGQTNYVDIGKNYAGRRLRELAEYGLVEELERGLYRLTDEGERYLDGELDAAELSMDGE